MVISQLQNKPPLTSPSVQTDSYLPARHTAVYTPPTHGRLSPLTHGRVSGKETAVCLEAAQLSLLQERNSVPLQGIK